jgi:short-subunit dehydrogenase
MRIRGAVVLVTGASEGIGAACVREFRRRGASVALVARHREKLDAVAQQGDLVLPADLTVPEQRRALVDRTVERFGRLDILVNNAAVALSAPSYLAAMDDVRRLFELNVFAALELSQLAAAHMRPRRSGAIVNIGSVAGMVAMPWFTLYSATKFALRAMTDGLRMELKDSGVHAMLVCPGFVRTEFHAHTIGGPPPHAKRRGRPAEITAEDCARRIADGVERDRRTIVTPKRAYLLVLAHSLFPGIVENALAARNREDAA